MAVKVQAPELSTYNGKSYGFVFEASNGFRAMVYNKTVFEENGIEVPTTTEEMYAAADKLKAAGVTPFVLASDNWIPQIWMTSGFMRAIGVESEVQDMTEENPQQSGQIQRLPRPWRRSGRVPELLPEGLVQRRLSHAGL